MGNLWCAGRERERPWGNVGCAGRERERRRGQSGVRHSPAFPIEAALMGFGAAVLVGALAGAIPALVAVRVKVIDAIRF